MNCRFCVAQFLLFFSAPQMKQSIPSPKNKAAVQCAALAKNGKRCKLTTKDPSGLCHLHRESKSASEPVPVVDRRISDKRFLYPNLDALGKGTYGKVYLTRGPDQKMRAVKTFMLDTKTLRGVEGIRELDILLRLRHPHIIAPVDYYFPTKRPLEVVLPLGKDFASEEVAALLGDGRKAAAFCFQVGSAFLFLHRHGLYHCDLKPQNVLLVDGVAKVADFGLVKYADSYHNAVLCNSSGYEPPEPKARRTIAKSEMWALGIFFYYCLSGGLYFFELEPKERKNFVPPVWRPLLAKMLHPDPLQRVSTVEEVLQFPAFSSSGLQTPPRGFVLSSPVSYGPDSLKVFKDNGLTLSFLREGVEELEHISSQLKTYLSVYSLALDLLFRGALLWPAVKDPASKKNASLPLVMASYLMAMEIYEETVEPLELAPLFSSGKVTSRQAVSLARRFLRALEGRVGGDTVFTASPSLPVLLRCLRRLKASPGDYLLLGPSALAQEEAESGSESKLRSQNKTSKETTVKLVLGSLREKKAGKPKK